MSDTEHPRYAIMGWGSFVAKVVLVSVFALTGVYKLSDPLAFHATLVHYGFVHPGLLIALLITVPSVELSAAALIALRVGTRAVAAVVAVLLSLFTLLSVLSGSNHCGCFPFSEPTGMAWLTGRNGLLILLCIYVVACETAVTRRRRIDSPIRAPKVHSILCTKTGKQDA